MFEAHTLSVEELQTLLRPTPGLQKTYHRTHAHSLRPLRIWFAEGKRKDAEGIAHRTWFAYVEYRDDRGGNRYHCLERSATEVTLDQLLTLAVQAPLPGV